MTIQKREIFRRCFEKLGYDKIAVFREANVERILTNESMIRLRRKAEAIIHFAQCFQKIKVDVGRFSQYLWSFLEGKTILYAGHHLENIPAKNALSEERIKILKSTE